MREGKKYDEIFLRGGSWVQVTNSDTLESFLYYALENNALYLVEEIIASV